MPALMLDAMQVAAASAGVAAASLTGFGLRHAPQRGWRWWMGSVWLAALGGALASLLPPPAQPADAAALLARFAAEMLLLQWPLTLLIGLRRFHARDALPLHASVDFGLLLLALPVLALAFAATPAQAPWVAAAAGTGALLYAALVALGTPAGHASPPLQALAAAQCLLAFLPLSALFAPGAEDPFAVRAVAAALGVLVAAFVVLTMVGQRTEQQLRDSRRRLRTLANMDALTQVPNRRHFHELATLALRRDLPGSAVLLMFDLDHFKGINDRFGHAAGDRALTLVSGSMLEHLRAEDVPGRLGGDEFALLLRGAGVPAAIAVASRIVQAVQRHAVLDELPPLTLSFGVVRVAGHESLAHALRRADQALFEAKRQGRNCAVSAEGDEDSPVFSESQRLGLSAA
ncbi:MAG: GGDEF domain-containing protein [Rubrivivax sp.]|nr:GGDEF domain-containing protein [Rubrivivax sp.]